MKRLILLLLIFYSSVSFAQQRDSRVREYISPTRIVWSKGGENIRGVDNLFRSGKGQADLANRNMCVLKSTDTEYPAIVLDYGKELQGGIQLVTGMSSPNKPIRVRIRFGESVGEAMSEIDGVSGAVNDHAMRDFVITLPWLGVLEVGNSGFRFVRVDLLDANTELQLKEVRAISSFRDISYEGSFNCNDERLNQIWQTGAYTVHLNMQEHLWDGIKRDRLVWIGDMHPEVMTINTVFGHHEVVPNSLDLVRDITPLPGWMNGISSYSVWWLLIQRDWYYYHGDKAYLQEQQAYLQGLLKLFLSKLDEKGMEHLDGWRFMDWPSSENPEAINAGLQSMMIMALQAGEELLRILGDNQLAEECKNGVAKALKGSGKVRKDFLKTAKDLMVPGYKQAAALMALSGVMPPAEADKKYLSVNGAKGFSTFYGYYMLRAMATAGNYQGALDVIRTYWGGMLDLGATTFWEDFDIDWLANAGRIDELVPEGKVDVHRTYGDYCYKGYRHSFCHGWASGPTAWLSEYVLGIQVIEPGCRKISVKPNLGDLEWAEGTFPTPYGVIKVRHEKDSSGKIKTTLDLPKGVEVI